MKFRLVEEFTRYKEDSGLYDILQDYENQGQLEENYQNSELSGEYDSEGNELHLEDVIGTDKDIVTRGIEEDQDKKIMINEVMRLNPRDRDIIILRYGLLGKKELTQKEVAEKLGISQSYISRIEKKVIKRLKTLVNY